ncbi:MAG: AIR carboxylase family protein [Candidatus Aenigmatarchaeota archaeon]
MPELSAKKILFMSGSGSDKPVVGAYQRKLKEKFGVQSDWRVTSAHRTPDEAWDISAHLTLNEYAACGCIAGYQNALAPLVAHASTKPVYALKPEVREFVKEFGMDPPDLVLYNAEIFGTLFLPPGVSVPLVIDLENGAVAMAKEVAHFDSEVKKRVTQYFQDKRGKVIDADREAMKGN